MIVEDKIVKLSNGVEFDNKEIWIGALLGRVENANDDASKAGFGLVGWVVVDIIMMIDNKMVETLIGAGVGNTKDMITVQGSEK